jgi:mediator of RNA polymerase II transcription subunit 4
MTHLLLGPLNHLNSVAQQLFQSLSPPHTKPPPPPAIAALANADAALAEAIQSAHIHQKKQQRIEALKAEVLSLEASWRTVIMQLEEGRRDLEAIILEGDVHLDAIEQAKAGMAVHGLFDQCSQLLMGRRQVPYPTPSSLHMRRV